jgi:anion transporter
MADLSQAILRIPLFSGLSREDIAKVLGKLEEESFAAGTTIFSQGESGDSFYLIESGLLQVVQQGAGATSEVIGLLGPLEWFGEMALLSGDPRSATIIAVKDTTLWKLSRKSWEELIQKYPTWLLHFCATLSRRLSRAEQHYFQSREAFTSLAEEFYRSRSADEQRVLRRFPLLTEIDLGTLDRLLESSRGQDCLTALVKSNFPLIRSLGEDRYELHFYFRDFLKQKLIDTEGAEVEKSLHDAIASAYEGMGNWRLSVHHALEAQDWSRVVDLLLRHSEDRGPGDTSLINDVLERIPPEHLFSDLRLVHIKAETLMQLGDRGAAVRAYQEAIAREVKGALSGELASRYQKTADAMAQQGNYAEALGCLRTALSLARQPGEIIAGDLRALYDAQSRSTPASDLFSADSAVSPAGSGFTAHRFRIKQHLWTSRWLGALCGLGVWAYLWFGTPSIGLEPQATKQLAWLSLTLIFWMFQVFPDYGVALIFALGLILSDLAKADVVLGGFASTAWFMSLGVLALGAAITTSGLFYRFSLQLVRFFPLNYHGQVTALGLMGIVVMALIPQQSARTAIISQMLVNLSESLGYKNPSKASTGLFVASFLGLGQLSFLFLTGSTTSLIAWGLLPLEVRQQFTWGYWFLAALIPTLVVVLVVLIGILFLYRPETRTRVSYKMVQHQLGVLGPLSVKEWTTLGVLCLTLGGWLTTAYHKVDGAWIALIALCLLVNSGVLGWDALKRGVDWEMLLYMGVTLSIPTLLTEARIDQWLVGLFSPLILPFADKPLFAVVLIALIVYGTKLVFTSFLTVVTLMVALLPLSGELGMSPWTLAMIILVASEVWFFRFQIDWHTLAYATTDGKGFTYPLMSRINPLYALAYILALVAAIPYWRFLGLIG